MTLTKERIINSIHDHFDLPKIKSAELVENLLDIIKETLENGDDILISGFGKFSVKDQNGCRGKISANQDDKMLELKRVVTFRCSTVLRSKLNGNGKV